MSKHKKLIRELDSGCNDGQGDLPSVLSNAARALEAANKKEAKLKWKISVLTGLLAAANDALDAIASRVDTDAFDDSSSALESIGDTLVSTGRDVWADAE